MSRTSLIVGAIIVVLATGVAAMRLAKHGEAADPASAPTAVATLREFTPRVTATGNVRLLAGARVAVGARVSGVVERLAVTQGSRVSRGDLIAVLDSREARAGLADAESRIRQLQVDSAQAAADGERAEALFRSRVATEQEVLVTRTARLRVASQLDAARAARDRARLALDYTTIRAPVSGIVASVSTHEGETVAASFAAPTFVTIVDPTRLECIALVDETDIGRVRVGQTAEFTVDPYPGRTFSGVVTRIAPDATIISGVVDYEVTIRVTSDIEGLKPQMTANIIIATETKRALVVPSAAVRQGAQGLFVWKLANGKPVQTTISAGARQLDVTEIRSGLTAGDSVLVGGFPEGTPP
jgi:RND family efflux transporter MFP subunit